MSEYLIFDDVTLDGPIECEDLLPLRSAVKRGNNRILSGASGRRALPLVLDELSDTLVWYVTGNRTVAGQPQDPEAGVIENLEFYRNLFTSAGDANSEHDIELHLEDFVFTGSMQIVEYAERRTGPMTATILTRFRIASGELTQTGS